MEIINYTLSLSSYYNETATVQLPTKNASCRSVPKVFSVSSCAHLSFKGGCLAAQKAVRVYNTQRSYCCLEDIQYVIISILPFIVFSSVPPLTLLGDMLECSRKL